MSPQYHEVEDGGGLEEAKLRWDKCGGWGGERGQVQVGGAGNCQKSNPIKDWHGDSLAYLKQKSQSHHVSKVSLKQWHQDLKIFYLSSLISGLDNK